MQVCTMDEGVAAQAAVKELWLSTKRAKSEDELPPLLEKDAMAAR